MRDRPCACLWRAAVRRPVRKPIDILTDQRRPGQFDAGPRVANCEAGPPHVILQRRRSMAREIPPCELGKRRVAIDQGRFKRTGPTKWYALIEERIGQLMSAAPAAADHGVELSAQGQKCEARPAGDNAGSAEGGAKLGTRQMRVVAQHAFEDVPTARRGALVDLHLAVVVSADGI